MSATSHRFSLILLIKTCHPYSQNSSRSPFNHRQAQPSSCSGGWQEPSPPPGSGGTQHTQKASETAPGIESRGDFFIFIIFFKLTSRSQAQLSKQGLWFDEHLAADLIGHLGALSQGCPRH